MREKEFQSLSDRNYKREITGSFRNRTEKDQKKTYPFKFGSSFINIYMVAFVEETFGAGKDIFFRFVSNNGISEKTGSAQAIWQVGKGDGVFLDILHKYGAVKDWDFVQF